MECMVYQTRHAFFGTNNDYLNQQERKKLKKLIIAILRYPTSKFFGIMVNNGSTSSLCSTAQLEAYINYTGYSTAMRRLKNQYMNLHIKDPNVLESQHLSSHTAIQSLI